MERHYFALHRMKGIIEDVKVTVSVHLRIVDDEMIVWTYFCPVPPGMPIYQGKKGPMKDIITCRGCKRSYDRNEGIIKNYGKGRMTFCSKDCYHKTIERFREHAHTKFMCHMIKEHGDNMRDDPEALGKDIEKFMPRPLNCLDEEGDDD